MDEKEERHHLSAESSPATTRWGRIRADKNQFTRVQQWTQTSPWVSLVSNAWLSISTLGLAKGPGVHKRHYWDMLCFPYSRCFIRKNVKGIYFRTGPKNIISCSSSCTSITKQNSVILTKPPVVSLQGLC